MPPAGRRRARKEPQQLPDEVGTPEATSTPSRKRRKVNGSDAPPSTLAASTPSALKAERAGSESDATIEHALDGDTDTEQADSLVDDVIRHLRCAQYDINAAVDYDNNVVQSSATAFAKIAGRSWTFYVVRMVVIIGRPSNKAKHESPASGGRARPPVNDFTVDIDLGPDQQISRHHAEIAFDPECGEWFIVVNGRNGLMLDDTRLERGQKAFLHSGNVITILGTQMMFLLPNTTPNIHPEVKKQAFIDEEEESEEETKDDVVKTPRTAPRGGRGRGGSVHGSQTRQNPSGSRTVHHSFATLPASSSQQPGTPTLGRPREQPQPRSRPSPAYSRGLLLESTEDIDYSADSSKDIKPPHSYAQMIGQAILSMPEEKATLAKIYEFIREKYAYFRHNGGGWQNSIRHNLSLSKHFEKIPRRTDEPGKGMKWQIVAEHRDEYMKKNFLDARTAPALVSSGPNSPATLAGPAAQTARLMNVLADDSPRPLKHSRSVTPPRAAFPQPNESFTPDRGPRPPTIRTDNLAVPNGAGSGASDAYTPTYDRSRLSAAAPSGFTAINSAAPPTSPPSWGGAQTASSYEPTDSSLFTPLVARQRPILAGGVQSTVKAPSWYAQELFSSPAPFWKYVENMGSTPARPGMRGLDDESPAKRRVVQRLDIGSDEEADVKMADTEGDGDGDDGREGTAPAPSSPLVRAQAAAGGSSTADASPSRTVSRPVSRHVAEDVKPVSISAAAAAAAAAAGGKKIGLTGGMEMASLFPRAAQGGPVQGRLGGLGAFDVRRGKQEEEDDEDEGGGIDLAKGFQAIGSFHRSIQAAYPMSR
ncbi:hypothetical protein EJ06DRAFT_269795 [Trichodelitschia bisporula]|uniref:Fork-head domain-containing protein n=1 Tax=Trichodelitschia bisporula TaxID=703511 RepID=A0A6G1HI60_9PEZI|nr:hypothetical protein EJ06DRAFT_269795 [Trichodelitschia bisporula]